jgi:hypothetical protein
MSVSCPLSVVRWQESATASSGSAGGRLGGGGAVGVRVGVGVSEIRSSPGAWRRRSGIGSLRAGLVGFGNSLVAETVPAERHVPRFGRRSFFVLISSPPPNWSINPPTGLRLRRPRRHCFRGHHRAGDWGWARRQRAGARGRGRCSSASTPSSRLGARDDVLLGQHSRD